MPQNPHSTALEKFQAPPLRVSRLHASPRLGESRGGVTDVALNGQHIGGLLVQSGSEDFGSDEMELNQAAGDGVAVGGAAAQSVIDIGLEREALTRVEFVLKGFAHLDHGQRGLVAQTCWFFIEVTVVEFGVFAALLDELDIGETHADGIYTH
ncbi:MAG: hypothetical protein BWY63_02308 [Chloroflexi bacterium ADurb.Bin360]|nr:MAG: hypothetical protein BWY63_02308 [Chloroflexi bacterium ADurb.Bin360]